MEEGRGEGNEPIKFKTATRTSLARKLHALSPFRQRQRIAGVRGLITGGREILEWIAGLVMPPSPDGQTQDDHEADDGQTGNTHLPIHLRQNQRQVIQKSFLRVAQRRRFAVFFRLAEFRVQRSEHGGGIQFERVGVILDRAADIDGRGEDVEVSLFERADVVGADLGHVCDLFHREFFGLATGAELFGNR